MVVKKREQQIIHGVLNIDKPPHATSHDVVAHMRALGCRKAGHAGTLDPLATGVLLVCIGQATKIVPFLQDTPKTYVARMCLGIRTDTQDASGRVLATASTQGIAEEDVRKVCAQFVGIHQQTPPMYSAVKYRGKPLYYFARRGLEVPRPSRTITIFSLDLLSWNGEEVVIKVICSGGTYIRTLCDDMGARLGCWAHLKQLVRTCVGPFALRDALSLRELHRLWSQGKAEEALYSLDQALAFLPVVVLSWSMAQQVCHGASVSVESVQKTGKEDPNKTGREALKSGQRVRLHDPDHRLLGIGETCYNEEGSPHVSSPTRIIFRPLRVLQAVHDPK